MVFMLQMLDLKQIVKTGQAYDSLFKNTQERHFKIKKKPFSLYEEGNHQAICSQSLSIM